MRAAGGRAVVVGSRDPDRARAWADANQVEHTADYAGALARDDVDAVYIALPNNEHTAWAARAVAAGRAVLCEKPLGIDATDTKALLSEIPRDARLWEAFVFPFHPQTDAIRAAMAELGRTREIISEFHFTASDPANIRWQADLAGGAMRDVGCYCIRLGRLLFEAEPIEFAARASWHDGVDSDVAAVVGFPDDRRLLLSAGMRGAPTTFTRVLGEGGELRIVNPFHPRPGNTVQRWAEGQLVDEWSAGSRLAFQCGVEHVHSVLAGAAEPRHLARTDALGNAAAIDGVLAAAR
jgi:D-xylose 1-dehydrogenase (NADP+, D-xylono-1,5-lactone-forming)